MILRGMHVRSSVASGSGAAPRHVPPFLDPEILKSIEQGSRQNHVGNVLVRVIHALRS